MSDYDYPIVRKPVRSYPLPRNLRELDVPRSAAEEHRYARVARIGNGYDSDEDPTRPTTRESYVTVLNRM